MKGSTMKKMILATIAIVALAGTSRFTARAGDRGCDVVPPCPPVSYVCSPPAYCPPPAPPCAYVSYCPPSRVVVIRNWSPANYCGPTVVFPAHPVVRYASRRGGW